VDGGVCSASNLDLVAGRGLDLVICLNPLSSGTKEGGGAGGPVGWLDPRDWLGALSRQANGRRLGHEAAKVRRFGAEVLLIEPTAIDHAAMGPNLMSASRRQQVIEAATRTVREQLQSPKSRQLLRDLPPGEPHKVRRPPGPPSSWPPLRQAVYAESARAA
jgi:NTE family protein